MSQYQSYGGLLTIWKRYGMRSNAMATLVAYCMSKERIKINMFLFFFFYTYISNGLKNMLEPG